MTIRGMVKPETLDSPKSLEVAKQLSKESRRVSSGKHSQKYIAYNNLQNQIHQISQLIN